MQPELTFIALAITVMGVASMAIRNVAGKRGVHLGLYVTSLILGAIVGGSIGLELGTGFVLLWCAAGVASVELGAALAAGVRKIIKRKADEL